MRGEFGLLGKASSTVALSTVVLRAHSRKPRLNRRLQYAIRGFAGSCNVRTNASSRSGKTRLRPWHAACEMPRSVLGEATRIALPGARAQWHRRDAWTCTDPRFETEVPHERHDGQALDAESGSGRLAEPARSAQANARADARRSPRHRPRQHARRSERTTDPCRVARGG